MSEFYILDGKTPVPCEIEVWGKWLTKDDKNDRKVKKTVIGEINISTVFLGLDHRFGHKGEWLPILFETMVFGGKLDGQMDRYCSWEQAEEGHEAMVKRVKKMDN